MSNMHHNFLTADQARTLAPGTVLRCVEMDIYGTFRRLCDNGREVEVDHNYDGGGFDFWPLGTLVVVPGGLDALEARAAANVVPAPTQDERRAAAIAALPDPDPAGTEAHWLELVELMESDMLSMSQHRRMGRIAAMLAARTGTTRDAILADALIAAL